MEKGTDSAHYLESSRSAKDYLRSSHPAKSHLLSQPVFPWPAAEGSDNASGIFILEGGYGAFVPAMLV